MMGEVDMSIHKNPYDRTTYILVIDDDQTLLKFFKIHLNKFFSKIVVVKNAKEAIEALGEKEIDLVISDIRMPRMDGIQLMKKVRLHDPSIPVFLVSGALLTPEQVTSIDEKADGFLKKPFSIDDLHGYIANGLRVRDIYKELMELVGDQKKFQNLVRGKASLKGIKDETARERATALMAELAGMSHIKQAG
jgi:DNA-binding NtrC family response regulator